VFIKLINPLMKVCRFEAELDISLKAVLVLPGSVKLQPPTETHVWSPEYLFFRAVKRE